MEGWRCYLLFNWLIEGFVSGEDSRKVLDAFRSTLVLICGFVVERNYLAFSWCVEKVFDSG